MTMTSASSYPEGVGPPYDMTWRDRAIEAMEDFIDQGEPFSADDLIAKVGPPDEDHIANSRASAVGALFGEYSRAGRITPVGVVRSKQKHRKGGMIRVWQAA